MFCNAFGLSNSVVRDKSADEAAGGSGGDKSQDKQEESSADEKQQEVNTSPILSEKRKALFEPLEPAFNLNGKRPSAESLLPPPDFESASYPKGWLIGKKRKLVNVDVVESMRRIAVQEMNRKVLSCTNAFTCYSGQPFPFYPCMTAITSHVSKRMT